MVGISHPVSGKTWGAVKKLEVGSLEVSTDCPNLRKFEVRPARSNLRKSCGKAWGAVIYIYIR